MPLPVLVVEDDEIARLILTTQLRQWALTVVETAHPDAAWHQFQQRRFALALVDLQLAERRSEPLIARLRGCPDNPNRDIPVIAVSGTPPPASGPHALGFDAWLVKPVTPARLAHALRPHLALPDRPRTPSPRPARAREAFLAGLPATLSQLEARLRERAWGHARPLAHRLHGGAGFCGFATLARRAAALEAALERGDPAAVRQTWTALKEEARHLTMAGPED